MARVEFEGVWVRIAAKDKPARLAEPAWSVFEEPLRVVVLKERDDQRAIAIWMGSADAFSLLRHHRGIADGRPVAAAVMAALLDATGGRVDHVEITGLHDNVWRSVIHLQADAGPVQLDARPSDALNLALRVGAPILVAEEVMSDLAFPIDQLSERLERWQHQDIDALECGQWRDLSSELISELRDVAAA